MTTTICIQFIQKLCFLYVFCVAVDRQIRAMPKTCITPPKRGWSRVEYQAVKKHYLDQHPRFEQQFWIIFTQNTFQIWILYTFFKVLKFLYFHFLYNFVCIRFCTDLDAQTRYNVRGTNQILNKHKRQLRIKPKIQSTQTYFYFLIFLKSRLITTYILVCFITRCYTTHTTL